MTNNKLVIGLLTLLMMSGIAFATLSGPSPIPNPPTFTISSSLLMLCKGETNYIPITITDAALQNPSTGITNYSGTAMQNIELAVNPTKGLLQAGNGTAYVKNINPYQSNTVYLPIFVTANASLITSMAVGINYYYLELYSDSETRNLTFEAGTCPSPLSVSVNPKTVTPGEIQNISINFTNTGNSTLKDLYVHYTVPSIDGAIVGSSQAEIGNLSAKSGYRLNASVFVSRNASIESFPFNLTATFYNGAGSIEQVTNSSSLIPVGAIDLSSSDLTLSPTSVTPGGIISISFVLTDVGTTGASAVSVGAVLPKGFSPFGSNPVYVGDISEDGQTPVTLSMEASNTVKAGTYNVPIQINFLNGLRQNESTTSNVAIVVSSGTGSGTGGLAGATGTRVYTGGGTTSGLLLPIALVIVIIAISYLYVKERKKNRRVAAK